MQSLVQKLPSYYAMEWVEYKRRAPSVDLETFGMFMEALVEKALEATFERTEANERDKKREKPKAKSVLYAADGENDRSSGQSSRNCDAKIPEHSSQPQQRDVRCAVCHKMGHFGRNCQEFLRQSVADRWKMVEHLNLCPCCMYDHGDWPCRIRRRCTVDDCPEFHNPLLHSESNQDCTALEVQCNSHRQLNPTVLFRMVPITLYNGSRKVDTLALIDEGSAVTLINKKLAGMLKATGPVQPLQMYWTNGIQQRERYSKVVQIQVSAQGSSKRFDLVDARTVKKLELPSQRVDAEDFTDCDHLCDLEISGYDLVAPQVLLGIDNLHLVAPLESRIGDPGEPVAVRSQLGWTVYGPRPSEQ